MKKTAGLAASFAALALGGYLVWQETPRPPARNPDVTPPAVKAATFPEGAMQVEIHSGSKVTYQGVGAAGTVAEGSADGYFRFNDLCHGGAVAAAKGDGVTFSRGDLSCPAAPVP